jgi:hypothetical protein
MAKRMRRSRHLAAAATSQRGSGDYISFGVQLGNIFEARGDVAAFKYSEGAAGLFRLILSRFRRLGVLDTDLQPPPGKHVLVSANRALNAPRVLIVGTAPIGEFDYEELKKFSERVLEALSAEAPETSTLLLPLHGANLGLDQAECARQEVFGCVAAINSGRYPKALREITLVERDRARYELIVRSLDQLFRSSFTQPAEWTPQPDRWCIAKRTRARAGGYEEPPRKPTAFVAMAFGKTRDVWRFGIQRPLQEIVLCERMDETAFTGDILSEIKKRIARADIVIADITGANPNVFLEIGYAWAAETPTVLVCKKPTDGAIPPFDVRGQRYIEYEDITDLEDKLTKEVQALLPISGQKRRST